MKFFLPCLSLALLLGSSLGAHATTITSATIYTGIPDVNDANDPANATANSANFTIGSAGINFTNYSSTIAAFLNNPSFYNVKGTFSSAGSPTTLEIVIRGTITLTAGELLQVTHDDGADLYLNGVQVISSPSQTVAITNSYSGESAGTYNFILDYAANGLTPSILQFQAGGQTVAPTPEPSSLLLLGTGLVSVAGFARRRFSRAF